MNSIILTGRLTRDPELCFIAGSGKAVCTFQLAVERPHSKEKITDFFNVVVWNKPGENAANFFRKGYKAAVRGYLTSRSYEDKTGTKRYVTEIVAGEVEFLSRPGAQRPEAPPEDYSLDGFQPLEDDDDIPF